MLLSLSSAGTSLQCLTPSKYSALFNKLMNKIKLNQGVSTFTISIFIFFLLSYYLYYLILRPKHKEL